jgi:hypothetical protein
VQRLKQSGLTAMTSATGVVFLVGSLFFAVLFACLVVRIYFMKTIVNRKREHQKVSACEFWQNSNYNPPSLFIIYLMIPYFHRFHHHQSAWSSQDESDDEDDTPKSDFMEHTPLIGRSSSVPHRHRKFKTKLGLVFLVFCVMYPAIIYASLKLPDSFTQIYTDGSSGASFVFINLNVEF